MAAQLQVVCMKGLLYKRQRGQRSKNLQKLKFQERFCQLTATAFEYYKGHKVILCTHIYIVGESQYWALLNTSVLTTQHQSNVALFQAVDRQLRGQFPITQVRIVDQVHHFDKKYCFQVCSYTYISGLARSHVVSFTFSNLTPPRHRPVKSPGSKTRRN